MDFDHFCKLMDMKTSTLFAVTMAMMHFLISVVLQTERNKVEFADWLLDHSTGFKPNNRNDSSKINDNNAPVTLFDSILFLLLLLLLLFKQ